MNSTRVVFFDAAGTLFHVRGSVGQIYSDIAREFGVNVDPFVLQRSFLSAFRAGTAAGFPAERERDIARAEKAWWMAVVRQAFGDRMPAQTLRPYFNRVFEFFRSAAAWELYPDVEPALRDLSSRGFRLGVISNFDSRLLDVLASLGIAPYFEAVFLSWRIGIAKPAPGIFRHALEAMKIGSCEGAHVGDSPEEDAAGALGAGLRAFLVDRSGAVAAPPGATRLGGLAELVSLLS